MAATGTIKGNTGAIRSTAATITQNAKSYGATLQAMFQTVDALKSSFTSEDGQAFIAKINSHKEAFEKLQSNLEEAANALEQTASNYEKTIKANTIR